MDKTISLSVIMPAFNEEASIEEVIREHYQLLCSFEGSLKDWEILCMDDGSTDRTPQILEDLSRELKKFRMVRHPINQGIFKTFCDLFKEARGNYIYQTASDGQWPAKNLIKMLDYLNSSQVDLVIGVRENRGQVYTLWRQLLSFGFNWIASVIFKITASDVNGIKLGKKEIFTLPLTSHSFFGEIERLVEAKNKSYKIGWAPIQFVPRRRGKERGAKCSNVIFTMRDCLIYLVRQSLKRQNHS